MVINRRATRARQIVIGLPDSGASMNWQNYQDIQTEHTVTGTLKVLPDFESPQLGNRRPILAYLPNSYETSDKRYPVLYMHDAQNLFDARTSFAGEWQVDETMQRL